MSQIIDSVAGYNSFQQGLLIFHKKSLAFRQEW
jgi:hypothetical protein